MGSYTGIDTYLSEISRYPLLTPQEEISLGRQVQEMLQLRDLDRPLTPEEQRVVKRGERAKQKFVRANLKLVVSAAKRYLHVVKTMDLMDLVQEGNLGLIRGVEKFDPSRGYKFSTYAYWWIRQSINRAIATRERAIRLPGKAQELATSWNTAMRNLHNQLGRTPRVTEIADYFKVSIQEVEHFIQIGMSPTISLDQVVRDEGGMAFVDLIEDHNNVGGTEAIDRAIFDEHTFQLEMAMTALSDREKELVARRWGLQGRRPETLVEIGKTMDVSRERVRQLLDIAQRKLRYHMNNTKKFRRYELPQQQEVTPPLMAAGYFT